ncbi:tRNA dimethylallyltransferase [Candidatus Saccharibacteria bacterium]|nr:tRNA dimethylallyltransferase [Candidatus Saccharibacteria bacterium]
MSSETTSNNFNKTIVILGPTGSGKTGVSIKIAKAIGGEIISADSRAIYKGMDIGTAKPSLEEQDGVPHFGIDLVEPGERFTVADFKKYAEEKIAEIQARGHVPIIAGGTGLYIDALVYDYQFGPEGGERSAVNPHHRKDNEKEMTDRKELCSNYLLIGVKTEPEVLRERLRLRAEQMFCPELYEETKRLVTKYGWDSQAMKSNIYQFAWQYMEGKISLERAKELFVYDDWHLAKRQMTWFKRTPEIIWLPLEKIYPYVLKYIQDEQRR